MSICGKREAVRDYALGEPAEPGIERHIQSCPDCACEFDELRLTTAALQVLPDREIPQRIAFVSDKVFKPSWFAAFWKPAMISGSMLAAALIIAARPQPNVVQVSPPPATVQSAENIDRRIDEAVAKAVADVRRENDQRVRTILAEARSKEEKEHTAVMEAINIMQQRQNAATLLAMADTGRSGAGQ